VAKRTIKLPRHWPQIRLGSPDRIEWHHPLGAGIGGDNLSITRRRLINLAAFFGLCCRDVLRVARGDFCKIEILQAGF